MARGSSHSKQPIPQNRFNAPKDKTTTWDELNVIRGQTREMFNQLDKVRQLSRNEELKGALNDQNHVARGLNALAADLGPLAAEYTAVGKAHEGRTGHIGEHEYMAALDISFRYFEINEKFNNNIMPVVADLLVNYDEAAEKLELAQKQQQNPEG